MQAVKARLWRASEFIIRSRDFCRVANDDEFRKVSSALYCPANLELVQLAAMIDACLRSPRDAVINLNQRYKAAFTSRYLRILTNLLFRAIGVTWISVYTPGPSSRRKMSIILGNLRFHATHNIRVVIINCYFLESYISLYDLWDFV